MGQDCQVRKNGARCLCTRHGDVRTESPSPFPRTYVCHGTSGSCSACSPAQLARRKSSPESCLDSWLTHTPRRKSQKQGEACAAACVSRIFRRYVISKGTAVLTQSDGQECPHLGFLANVPSAVLGVPVVLPRPVTIRPEDRGAAARPLPQRPFARRGSFL